MQRAKTESSLDEFSLLHPSSIDAVSLLRHLQHHGPVRLRGPPTFSERRCREDSTAPWEGAGAIDHENTSMRGGMAVSARECLLRPSQIHKCPSKVKKKLQPPAHAVAKLFGGMRPHRTGCVCTLGARCRARVHAKKTTAANPTARLTRGGERSGTRILSSPGPRSMAASSLRRGHNLKRLLLYVSSSEPHSFSFLPWASACPFLCAAATQHT